MFSALSIDDATASKVVGVLCLAIAHLYWESFRCRRAHADDRVRVTGLETAIRGCPAAHCPVRDNLSITLKPNSNE